MRKFKEIKKQQAVNPFLSIQPEIISCEEYKNFWDDISEKQFDITLKEKEEINIILGTMEEVIEEMLELNEGNLDFPYQTTSFDNLELVDLIAYTQPITRNQFKELKGEFVNQESKTVMLEQGITLNKFEKVMDLYNSPFLVRHLVDMDYEGSHIHLHYDVYMVKK